MACHSLLRSILLFEVVQLEMSATPTFNIVASCVCIAVIFHFYKNKPEGSCTELFYKCE